MRVTSILVGLLLIISFPLYIAEENQSDEWFAHIGYELLDMDGDGYKESVSITYDVDTNATEANVIVSIEMREHKSSSLETKYDEFTVHGNESDAREMSFTAYFSGVFDFIVRLVDDDENEEDYREFSAVLLKAEDSPDEWFVDFGYHGFDSDDDGNNDSAEIFYTIDSEGKNEFALVSVNIWNSTSEVEILLDGMPDCIPVSNEQRSLFFYAPENETYEFMVYLMDSEENIEDFFEFELALEGYKKSEGDINVEFSFYDNDNDGTFFNEPHFLAHRGDERVEDVYIEIKDKYGKRWGQGYTDNDGILIFEKFDETSENMSYSWEASFEGEVVDHGRFYSGSKVHIEEWGVYDVDGDEGFNDFVIRGKEISDAPAKNISVKIYYPNGTLFTQGFTDELLNGSEGLFIARNLSYGKYNFVAELNDNIELSNGTFVIARQIIDRFKSIEYERFDSDDDGIIDAFKLIYEVESNLQVENVVVKVIMEFGSSGLPVYEEEIKDLFTVFQGESKKRAMYLYAPMNDTYNFKVWLYDSNGKLQSSVEIRNIVLSTNGTEPLPLIISPDSNTEVSGTVIIKAVENSDETIIKTDFYYSMDKKEWNLIWTDAEGIDAWEAEWDTRTVEDGMYYVRAVMTTDKNWTGYDEIVLYTDNTKPTVNIISPLHDNEYNGTITIEAEGDEDVTFARFEYFFTEWILIGIDNTGENGWRMAWNTTELSDGKYIIRVSMQDNQGLNNSDSVTIYIDNTQPTVAIIEPENDALLKGRIRIYASGDDDVVIARFEYSMDGITWNLIGIDNVGENGWKSAWNTSEVSDGDYYIKVTMIDDQGFTGFAVVFVAVNNTVIAPERGIELYCKNTTKESLRNETVVFTIIINNTGELTEILEINISAPEGWSFTLTDTELTKNGSLFYLPLKEKSSALLLLSLSVPGDAELREFTISLRASNDTLSHDIELKVKVVEESRDEKKSEGTDLTIAIIAGAVLIIACIALIIIWQKKVRKA